VAPFILRQESLRIRADTREFAIIMSNRRFWEPPVRRYVEDLLAGREGPRDEDFNMRWAASMVADVFRILEVQPTSPHQRVPVILGSVNEVQRVTSYNA